MTKFLQYFREAATHIRNKLEINYNLSKSLLYSNLVRFYKDSSGSVALITGLTIVVLLIATGAAVDYARLTNARVKLQAATDSAALAIAASSGTTTEQERSAMAGSFVATQFRIATASVTTSEPVSGSSISYVVRATANVPLYFGAMFGKSTAPVSTSSTTVANGGAVADYEIALALDNTGSMATVIGDLRVAATNFVNTVMTGTNVKVSVVPYVAAVNPGLTDLTMIDRNMDADPHSLWMRSGWIANTAGCTNSWSGASKPSPGVSSSGDVGSSAIDLMEMLNPFRRFSRSLFGPTSAHAQGVTANTVTPVTTSTVISPATGKSYQIPAGFSFLPLAANTGGCEFLVNPGRISQYDLHNRIVTTTGARSQWKGCVEARSTAAQLTKAGVSPADDYDVKDIPPTAGQPETLFIPYFWPDEPDWNPTTATPSAPQMYTSAAGGYHNNYMKDFAWPAAWNWQDSDIDENGRGILRYDGVTPAIVKETWPNTSGPNASCPDAVLRLTNNKSAVTAKISGLGYWYNGGTVISEGLMWAWRTLSPKLPYADGKAYGTTNNNKVIVLMTDGVNGLATSAGTESLSDYSAYGYLGSRRLQKRESVTTFDQMADYLDQRTLAACANAKTSGIRIYTILFNHGLNATQTTRANNLLQSCATNTSMHYQATDLTSLNNAFANVSNGLGSTQLRLVK